MGLSSATVECSQKCEDFLRFECVCLSVFPVQRFLMGSLIPCSCTYQLFLLSLCEKRLEYPWRRQDKTLKRCKSTSSHTIYETEFFVYRNGCYEKSLLHFYHLLPCYSYIHVRTRKHLYLIQLAHTFLLFLRFLKWNNKKKVSPICILVHCPR